MKIKILHVFDHSVPLHSGYAFRSKEIIENQRRLGWITDHVTSPKHNLSIEPADDEENIEGLHFYRTKPMKGFLVKLPIIGQLSIWVSTYRNIKRIISTFKPDIIHAHSPALNGQAALMAGKKYNVPVVYEIRAFWEDAAVDHGTTKEGSLRYCLTRALETRVAREADAVTTICEGLRRDLLKRGLEEEKITVIPNAVDQDQFVSQNNSSGALREKLALNQKKVLGFIGSFYAYEGLHLILEAFELLSQERDDIRVLLVGGGPQEKRLRELAELGGIADKVIFAGRVPHETVQHYYDLVDIFIYPRLSMRLTELVTPLKPLEAMSQEGLVIASDVGGHKELITDGETGILFKAGDALALARAIQRVLEEEQDCDNIRKAGRAFIEKERAWAVSVEKYEKVYRQLLGNGK